MTERGPLPLEPEAIQLCDPRNPANELGSISIAISLKRIADAICGDDLNTGIHKIMCDIGYEIARDRG
jgi:hypothetical protein